MQEPELTALKNLHLCHLCVGEPFLGHEINTLGKQQECSYCNRTATSFTLGMLAQRIEAVFTRHYVRTTNEPSALEWMAIKDKESPYEWQRAGEPVVYAIMNLADIPELAAKDIQRILEDKYSDFESMTMSEETEFAFDSSYDPKGTDTQDWWEKWTSFAKSLKTEARFFNADAARTLKSVFAGIETMQTEDGRPIVIDAGPGMAFSTVSFGLFLFWAS